jgi:pyruvate/2-oxoglutarate/acetoin dehydrogenase E1 component
MSAALPFDEAVKAAIGAALAADPSRVVVTEDALAAWPAGRTFVVPIAERGALGLALGLALAGRGALVELSGTARLPAAAELLAEAGAIALAGEFRVPLVVTVPWGSEAAGLDRPAARWLLDVPGLDVVAASCGAAAAAAITAAFAGPRPTVVLLPRALARDRGAPGGAGPLALARDGAHALLVASGAHVGPALAAAEALAADGFDVAVADLRQWSPFPAEALGALARRVGRVVFVGDDPALARRVHGAALADAFEYLESPLGVAAPAPDAVAGAVRAALQW